MNALRLVHYWWPVVLAWSIVVVVHRTTGRPVSSAGLCILLLGALAAYSLDRLRDSGCGAQPRWLRVALWVAVAGAGVGGLALLPQLSTQKILLLFVLSLITLLYPIAKHSRW